MRRSGVGRRILVGAGFAGCLAVGALGGNAHAQDRPNVIVIMTDDLDEGTLSVARALGWMPELEEHLVNLGTTFANSYVANSLCCPSRATLLTGQYSHNNGVRGNFPPLGGCSALDDTSTLATWLQGSGYRTGHVGKYLNLYGTDGAAGTGCTHHTYVPPGYDDWQGLVDYSTYKVYDYTVNDNGTLVTYGDEPADYQTDVLADRAVEFITESDQLNDAQPFFLNLNPLAPHIENINMPPTCQVNQLANHTIRAAPRHLGSAAAVPLPLPPSFNEADISDKPLWMQTLGPMSQSHQDCTETVYRSRLESLRAIDDMIGGIFDALDATGETSNTVVLFTSDNGYMYGEHRLHFKMYAYEEAIRVPLIVRAPGMPGSRTTTKTAVNTDLAPTIVDFAQMAIPSTVDGVSLAPLLDDPEPQAWRRLFLVEHWLEALGIHNYGAVRFTDEIPFLEDQILVVYRSPAGQYSIEFYDLLVDPYQLDSLHQDTSENRLWQKYIAWVVLKEALKCGDGTCQSLEFATPP